ncbi:hypothetical protein [Aeromonas salmonicida]|uniref:hypothetical protein n=1 Tax=Aeromonas salmonicida TaxID=645 RepID=UPI003D1DB7EA
MSISTFSKEQPFNLNDYEWAFTSELNRSIRIIGDQTAADALSLRIQKSPQYSYQVYTISVNPNDNNSLLDEPPFYDLTLAITTEHQPPELARSYTTCVCCLTPNEAVGSCPAISFLANTDWVMLKHIAAALIKANLLPQEAVELEAKRVKARADLN